MLFDSSATFDIADHSVLKTLNLAFKISHTPGPGLIQFIHSFDNSKLSPYHMLSTILEAEDTERLKDKSSCFHLVHTLIHVEKYM